MFPWRKRNEGFEWKEYVRTTVLARRAHRRQKIEDVKVAAVEQVRVAGQRGVEAGKVGFAAAAEKMRAAGRWSARAGSLGWAEVRRHAANAGRAAGPAARAVGRKAVDGVSWAGSAARAGGKKAMDGVSRAGDALRPGVAWSGERLSPLWSFARRRDVAAQAAVAGGGLALAALARIVSSGFDAPALAATLAAILLLGLSLGPVLWTRMDAALPGGRRGHVSRLVPPRSMQVAAMAFAVLALVFGVGYWTQPYWTSSLSRESASRETPLPAPPISSGLVEGKATPMSGDLLRFAGRTVRLSGIEAPEPGQECQRPNGQSWRCGQAATRALERLSRGRPLACQISGSDSQGYSLGSCRAGGQDVAGALVKAGHVFATQGFLSSYGGFESQAKTARAGIWSGGADRPSRYRAKRWEEAKRQAPDGCPIKGQLSGRDRVYVLPWSGAYEKIKLRPARGERWFCSEDEARAAGWKPG